MVSKRIELTNQLSDGNIKKKLKNTVHKLTHPKDSVASLASKRIGLIKMLLDGNTTKRSRSTLHKKVSKIPLNNQKLD